MFRVQCVNAVLKLFFKFCSPMSRCICQSMVTVISFLRYGLSPHQSRNVVSEHTLHTLIISFCFFYLMFSNTKKKNDVAIDFVKNVPHFADSSCLNQSTLKATAQLSVVRLMY